MMNAMTWRRWALDRRVSSASRRSLSTTAPKASKDAASPEEGPKGHPQAFVKSKPSPGEWDENRTDPYFRPKPHPQSKFISAEDFANRPPVGFDGEFNSYEDAMISLTWMDQKTSKEIYLNYQQMMLNSQREFGITSHEYVVRMIAQRFHLTTMRAAGIIQLQHAEEQMQRNNPELLCHDQADHAEKMIMQNITDAYKSERLPLPIDRRTNRALFFEDPVGIHGKGEPDETSTQWTNLDDIFDTEQKLQRANILDAERAQILIDNHMYKEDKDEDQEMVKIDSSSRKLIASQEKLAKEMAENTSNKAIPHPETNGKGEKRARWKYVAQIVNTRHLKKKQHEAKGRRKSRVSISYTNNTMGNTLVEQNGELRVATIAEAKQTSWKPTRTRSNEYLYEGAKKAWLQRTLHGKTDVWGEAPKTTASASIAAQAKEAATSAVAAESENEKTEITDESQAKDDAASDDNEKVETLSDSKPTKSDETDESGNKS